jgi:hypothetical protein
VHVVVSIGLGALLTAAVVIWLCINVAVGMRRRRKERERLERLRAAEEAKRLKALERQLASPSKFRFWRR